MTNEQIDKAVSELSDYMDKVIATDPARLDGGNVSRDYLRSCKIPARYHLPILERHIEKLWKEVTA